ncbi:RsmB/NOP family class I SAM-dependent RNA methyltransferase [uncultured Sphingorhabdus sp.]|uniref:RsmB/NOP family class I SAM-dependent RNA methyltransferase n=1 Tax=uncultured Sphingorhabdus sp. TaxID=1686106 RepID=UPI00261AE2A0|nr:RsmB/NOP family class I SAM-dependent RNA methyltransferase [uncultured Sphingorhabdus sp.]HMS21711.1 RsmB/NOP family class I SAM-dependent RNA methyltransferase [Sphingorhabdus sp.]
MTPAARVQASVELLDAIITATRDKGASADRIAAAFFAVRRYAGSKDRRAVRDLTWRAIRTFGERPENGRSAMVALADRDSELAALFDGLAYGPVPIAADEQRATGGVLPEWVKPLFSALLAEGEYPALLERAPLDIRMNRLIADRDAVAEKLPEAAVLAESRDGLRLPTGYAIESSELYTSGAIEVQDLGSQLIAEACYAQPGMTVLDLCAGAGGKTLALASHMAGQGRLVAADTNRDRLQQLPPRAARAKAGFIETLLLNPNKEKGALEHLLNACDVVLIDAPCSGSGTWRRNPETRWRLDQRDLQRLVSEQGRLLDLATALVKPGGHLVYAVCSLFGCEGRDQIDAFLLRHPDFEAGNPELAAGRPDGAGILLTPAHDGSDGFYLARLHKL